MWVGARLGVQKWPPVLNMQYSREDGWTYTTASNETHLIVWSLAPVSREAREGVEADAYSPPLSSKNVRSVTTASSPHHRGRGTLLIPTIKHVCLMEKRDDSTGNNPGARDRMAGSTKWMSGGALEGGKDSQPTQASKRAVGRGSNCVR